MKKKFVFTEHHLALLREMWWDFDVGCGNGGPAVDTKRPYGNGDMLGDIERITGVSRPDDPARGRAWGDWAEGLHRDTVYALQIILSSASLNDLLGEYQRPNTWSNWVRPMNNHETTQEDAIQAAVAKDRQS